jgi:hypothetical protein
MLRLAALLGSFVGLVSAQTPRLPVQVRSGMESLYFEPNVGQSDAAVHFLARGPGYTIFLTSTGAAVRAGTTLRMVLVGANPSAAPEASDPRAGRVHYLTATRMHTGVPTFGQVVYRGVYPGIDIVYHGKEGRLEYDFVVAPGSDPSAIRLSFLQGQAISYSRENGLTLRTPEGELRQPSPRFYQELGARRMEIDGEWIQTGAAEFGFRVGSYDRTRPLVVDPVLLYSSFLGGSSENAIASMALDASGNIYVAGWTTSTDFPASNAEQGSSKGGVDAFVTKLNPAGDSLVYSTYLGGSYEDRAFGIAVDSSGCPIVTGWTYSSNFPVRNAAQPLFGGQRDAFVTKLTAAGTGLVFSTFLGGAGEDGGNGVAVDPSGNIYVVGDTSSVNFPALNAYQRSNQGQQNAFVAKLGPTGTLLFSTYLGGSADDHGTAIALDASEDIYLTGGTTSTNFPVVSAFQSRNAGGQDAFVAKFNSTGSTLLYSTYLGGSGGRIGYPELGNAIAVDAAGEACVAGTTSSTNFPVANAFQPSMNGTSIDAFVAKLSASGASLVYSTYLGGSGPNSGTALALDSSGNAYVAGYTASTDFPVSSAIQAANAGLYNAFAVILSPTGSSLLFGTYLGGEESDAAYAIAVDALGDIYIAGQTLSYAFPTVNALEARNLGGYSGFIAKMQPYSKAVMSTPAPGTTLAGSTVTFTWSAATGATAYWLDVGPSPGVGSYFGQNVGLATSQTATGIPANGTMVAVRLWTLLGGVWYYNDYSYTAATAASAGTKAVMSTPVPGTTLAGSTVTFTWSAATGATAYWLDVGPSPGVGSYFGKNVGLATSQTATGIPVDGSIVAVRLWTLLGGVWYFNDYSYTAATAASAGTKAVMSTPAPGTTLAGSSVTFTWSAGSGATAYWLDVGPSPGVGSYFGKNVGLATSQTVTGIPVDGSMVAVRLWTLLGGVWYYNDYSYTAFH